LRRKNVHGDVVQDEITKDAFEFLKARMIYALFFLIPKYSHEIKCVVTIDANKVGIVGVLLQEDASRSLRSCIY
jgi:hypothetical protein